MIEDTMHEYGFKLQRMNGGIYAWRKDVEDGSFYLVTDEHAMGVPHATDEMILVGYYKDEEHEGHAELVSFYDFERHFML
jgi:hypothetical protein